MAPANTKFIRKCAEFIPRDESSKIPKKARGIYALLHHHKKTDKYDVVYVGITSESSMGRRLARHKISANKTWSHFSIFEVFQKIDEARLKELEGLFLEIYRKDSQAIRFNRRKKFQKLQDVREDSLSNWKKRKKD